MARARAKTRRGKKKGGKKAAKKGGKKAAKKAAKKRSARRAPPTGPDGVALPEAWSTKEQSQRTVKRWGGDTRRDDPGARVVHAPSQKGIGDGKAFHFLFGLRTTAVNDRRMLDMELAHIDDDIQTLCAAGYTVVVDRQSTKDDFFAMLESKAEGAEGLGAAGFYWSAHGMEDGSIQCCDGELIHPRELEGKTLADALRVAVFGACYVGSSSRTWRKALGGKALVVGWGRPVTIDRAVQFLQSDPSTETDLDDVIRRYLLVDSPLPGPDGERYSPAEPAVARGRLENLAARMQNVAEMLGAQIHEDERSIHVIVPLEDGRRQRAQVFVCDALQPFAEGEPMLCVESDVGELSHLVDPAMLLGSLPSSVYARVALVKSDKEMPNIVTQGFLPLARVRDQDLAALIHDVANCGDVLEKRIFGGDMR
jgi:hypothetical protein